MFCTQCGDSALETSKFCRKCGAALISPAIKELAPRRPPPLPPQRPSGHPAAAALGAGTVSGLTPAAPATIVYASFGRRFAAFVIDFVLIFLLYSFADALLRPSIDHQAFVPLVLLALIAWPYKAIMESSAWQATFGKRALGIKVTSLQGERISFWRATGRFYAQGLSQLCFYIGYLVAAFTKRRQALHDLLANTLVVKRDASPAEIALSAPAERGEGVITVMVVAIIAIFVIGVLAAIAIPAYQDYTIRSQVTHGITLADPYKVAVSEALVAGTESLMINSGPGGTIALNTPSSGPYEDSVAVVTSNILISYGQQANTQLKGRHLAIYPIKNLDGTLTWVCGRSVPVGEENNPSVTLSRSLTDVQDRYLPTSCKG
jgi:uncharacterized RDD family membrane protein YckC/Tfp pilus assembly major pilin PilA